MDALTSLFAGFETALHPMNLLYALIGVTLGTLVGVLPGIGPALTVALLLLSTRAAALADLRRRPADDPQPGGVGR